MIDPTVKQTSNEFIGIICGLGKYLIFNSGRGGNYSIKDKSGLWIKKSGVQFDQAKDDATWIFVDANGSYESAQGKPSLELPMHQIIPSKFVIHFHYLEAIWAFKSDLNVLEKILLKEEAGLVLIETATPGKKLSDLIVNQISDFPNAIYILENHGVIIAADQISGIWNLLNHLICEIRKFSPLGLRDSLERGRLNAELDLATLGLSTLQTERFMTIFKNLWPIMPDQAVFARHTQLIEDDVLRVFGSFDGLVTLFDGKVRIESESDELKDLLLSQVVFCLWTLLAQPYENNLNRLSDYQIEEICGLDSEKYRIELAADGVIVRA